MRCLVVTQSEMELDHATEAFLFNALAALECDCDSLRSCQDHLERRNGLRGVGKPFCVTLLLSTGEHQIVVKSIDATNNVLTACDAIRIAIDEAHSELRELKLTNKCTTCCYQQAVQESSRAHVALASPQ